MALFDPGLDPLDPGLEPFFDAEGDLDPDLEPFLELGGVGLRLLVPFLEAAGEGERSFLLFLDFGEPCNTKDGNNGYKILVTFTVHTTCHKSGRSEQVKATACTRVVQQTTSAVRSV